MATDEIYMKMRESSTQIVTPWGSVYRSHGRPDATWALMPECPPLQLYGHRGTHFTTCATFRLRFFAGGRHAFITEYPEMYDASNPRKPVGACAQVYMQCILAFRALLMEGLPDPGPRVVNEVQEMSNVCARLVNRTSALVSAHSADLSKALSMLKFRPEHLSKPHARIPADEVKQAEHDSFVYVKNVAESNGHTKEEPFLLATRLILQATSNVLPAHEKQFAGGDNASITYLMIQVYRLACDPWFPWATE
jgi:hypothetical protein